MITGRNTIVEEMTNLYDEIITLVSLVTDPQGYTIVIFENGREKQFDSYEKACSWCYKHGFTD